MSDKADAHIHLFAGGFGESFTARPGVRIDEAALYQSFMKDHGVAAALVVGYQAQPWCRSNNGHLARMAAEHAWVHPVAYFEPEAPPDLPALQELADQRFVGVSFYVFGDEKAAAIGRISDDVWRFIADRRWLVSVNSRGAALGCWRAVLEKHPTLRLLISHLGLPPRLSTPPSLDEARRLLGDVLALASSPEVRVKLSGFYALTEPGHDYPHRAAWPYVEALAEAFATRRLLWASDFSPCLDWLTFPQTLDLFKHMPFLSDDDRRMICGGNLLVLLDDIQRSGKS